LENAQAELEGLRAECVVAVSFLVPAPWSHNLIWKNGSSIVRTAGAAHHFKVTPDADRFANLPEGSRAIEHSTDTKNVKEFLQTSENRPRDFSPETSQDLIINGSENTKSSFKSDSLAAREIMGLKSANSIILSTEVSYCFL
jgi:hypothetical protein